MAHRTLLEINLAAPPARFEREPSAALAQAAHLQNLRRRKLVEISNQRMTGIDSFRRSGARMRIERGNETAQRRPHLAIASADPKHFDVLLLCARPDFGSSAAFEQASNGQRRKVLAQMGRLLERELGVALDDDAVEIFVE